MGLRCAVILPRYGSSLGGGAETLTRELFLKLVEDGTFSESEVWTTTAKDHRTWANDLPSGASIEDGVVVRRFEVDERDLEPFIRAEHRMARGEQLSLEEQFAWMENSVNSRKLYKHIEEYGPSYDLLLFAPYLFATTFWGAQICPERSILIPCLHDEPYAYQKIFGVLFSKVRGLFFNAEAERKLASELYPNSKIYERSGVVGLGFAPKNISPNYDETLRERGLKEDSYILYSGRKELGKNLDLLIEYYESLGEGIRANLRLVLIGSGEVHFRGSLPEGAIDFGFVTEEEKLNLMAGALALVQPSTNESFSIVLLEALQQKTPVIVHSHCRVTSEHVRAGNCGLSFGTKDEFKAVVKLFAEEPNTVKHLGEQGALYVEQMYSWEAVTSRAREALEKIGILRGEVQKNYVRQA